MSVVVFYPFLVEVRQVRQQNFSVAIRSLLDLPPYILSDAYSLYACLEAMLYDIALNYSSLLLGSEVHFPTFFWLVGVTKV